MAGSRRSGGRVSPELAAVGERLRQAREAAGRSLEDIEAVTRIRVAYLEAIDAGLRAELPGDVFVKGFVRAYANAVGLEGDLLVAQYKRSLEAASPQGASGSAAPEPDAVPPIERARPPSRPAPDVKRRTSVRRAGAPRRGSRAVQGRDAAIRAARARIRARRIGPAGVRRGLVRWVIGGVAVVAVGFASYALAGYFARRAAPAAKASATTGASSGSTRPPATKHPPAVAAGASAARARPAVQVHFVHQADGWHGTYVLTAAASQGLAVRITTRRPCWTDRWTDGSTRAQSLTLPAGGSVTWKASRTLRVEVANAPGVRGVTVNGLATPALPPEHTHVEWLTFRRATSAAAG